MDSDRPSHTPGPVSPPAPLDSPSPSASPPASTVALVTALLLQLAALATIARPLARSVEACLEHDPPANAWKIFVGLVGATVIVVAPTPSVREALSVVKKLLPGGNGK